MDQVCLKVEDAAFRYESRRLLFHDVSFSLRRGETLTILGPNGAGKSTLLDCIGGLKRLCGGRVSVDGRPLEWYSRRQLAQKISYVPQIHTRTYDFTVREYVAMGRAPYVDVWSSPSEEDYRLVDEAIAHLELSHLSDKPYTQLSGGECQQVLIARAMVQQAEAIILDEPTNHLDYGNQLKILRQMKRLAGEGYGLIWTTHMPDHALLMGGRVAILDREGRLTTGDAFLLTEERLAALYGAEVCLSYIQRAGREACVPYRL